MSTATATANINAIAIGGFDGMHIGHQRLFDALGSEGAILVIETGCANLTPGREREHFSHYPIFYYRLDAIRHLDGSGFIEKLQREFQSLQKIVVGYDFHFGKDRQYTFHNLKELFDGEVLVIDEVKYHNESVHSHKIRAKLKRGDIRGANNFLGHNYTLKGQVVSGQGLGAKALVPTLNLHVKEFLLPMEGVYATLSRLDDEEHWRPSVSFIGHRLSTDGSFAVETHILDASVHASRSVAVGFVDLIRANRKFGNMEALKKAIEQDMVTASRKVRHLSL